MPTDRRMWAVFKALDRGWTVAEIHELTKIDPWFLTQFSGIVELCRSASLVGLRGISHDMLRTLKRAGVGDAELAGILGADEGAVRNARREADLRPAYKRIDTCAAEFESFTPYLYGTYERECEAAPTPRQKVVILGQRTEPDRAGHRVRLLLLPRRVCAARGGVRDRDGQLQPRDGVDRLRHRRSAVLRAADLRGCLGDHRPRAGSGRRRQLRGPVRRSDAAQACAVASGSGHPDPGHVTRFDRPRRGSRALRAAALGSRHSAGRQRHGDDGRGSARRARLDRLSPRRPSVLRPRRTCDGDRLRHGRARPLHGRRRRPPRQGIRS